jgi:ABC-type multidrug transport system permease subunit
MELYLNLETISSIFNYSYDDAGENFIIKILMGAYFVWTAFGLGLYTGVNRLVRKRIMQSRL